MKRIASALLLMTLASFGMALERPQPRPGLPQGTKGPFVLTLTGFKGNPENGCQYLRQVYVWIGPAREITKDGIGAVLAEQPDFETVSLNGQIFTIPQPGERPYWESGGGMWLSSDIKEVEESDGR